MYKNVSVNLETDKRRCSADVEIALTKRHTLDIEIDEWTEEQKRYATAYAEGT